MTTTRAEASAEADLAALRRLLTGALRLRQDGAMADRTLIGIVRAHAAYDAEVDALRKALDRPTPDGVGLAAVAEIGRLRGLVAGGWVAMQALLRDAGLEWDVDEVGLVESVRLLMLRLRAARAEIKRLNEALAIASDEASRLRGGRGHGR